MKKGKGAQSAIRNPQSAIRTAEEVLRIEKEHLFPCVAHAHSRPPVIVRGEGARLYDIAGKEYIDCFAGIATACAGHCHPRLVKALGEQAGLLWHTSTLFPTVPLAQYAAALAGRFPPGMDRFFFVNSGSEAVENAVLLAKRATGSHLVLSLNNSFHGRTLMAMSLTNQGSWRQNIAYASGVLVAPSPNCYRCDFRREFPGCDYECARYVEMVLRCQSPGSLAAFIAEPVQGNGGVVVPPPDYFKIVLESVRKRNGLFICDEVQTGFGRLGRHLWGFQHWDVLPDIVTLGKGIASGFPLGGVAARSDVAACLKPKEMFSTYGGGPLAMAVALENLKVIDDEALAERAGRVGAVLQKGLRGLMEEHPLIGDVRGKGLMIGVELVKDRATRAPAPAEAKRVIDSAKERGLIVGLGGLDGNVLRVKPPLVIGEREARAAVAILGAALGDIEGGT